MIFIYADSGLLIVRAKTLLLGVKRIDEIFCLEMSGAFALNP